MILAPASEAGRTTLTTAGKRNRLPALDFTKGALVLFMVLYHWLNYFYGFKHDIYKYLRFLTPSFIFITGFLISNVYVAKYRSDPRVPKRLLHRGLKILVLFVLINAGIVLLAPGNGRIVTGNMSVKDLIAVYVAGNTWVAGSGKAAAFPVLLPISYLLLLSADLLIVSRYYKYVFHIACAVLFLGVMVAGVNGVTNANLELLAIGLLGVVLGYIPVKNIDWLGKHPYALSFAYICYLAAITAWNVHYVLQVAGVCLTVALLYLLGARVDRPNGISGHIILLGKYSLFAYIAQIAIVQLLHRGLWRFGFGAGTLAVSLAGAFGLTMLSVETVDRLRKKSDQLDRLYKAVFA